MNQQKIKGNYIYNTEPRYSTVEEFREKLDAIAGMVQESEILAYTDTLKDGSPDPEGNSFPLIDFVSAISAKVVEGELDSAVNDIYHFDDSPFSLISYLMKAQMAGSISAKRLTDIALQIPLPPNVTESFSPPRVAIVAPPHEPPCICEPKVKIRVTWTYRPKCGNYTKEIVGYAVNNTLKGMSGGKMYRFDAEVEGCSCGGSISNEVDFTGAGGASSGAGGGTVTIFAESSGNFTITFTYTCGCGCGKGDTASFDISF